MFVLNLPETFCHGKAAAELGFPLSQAELQKAVSEMDTDKHLGHPFVHPEGFLPPFGPRGKISPIAELSGMGKSTFLSSWYFGSKKTRAFELLKQCSCRKGVTCCRGVECVLRHGGTRTLNLQLGLGRQLPSRFFKITEKVGYPCWSTLNFCRHVAYVCTNVCAY